MGTIFQCRYCATLLHYSTTLENWEDKVDPICYWLKNFHLPICLQLSGRILLHQLRKTEPDVASHLLTYSLEYKNLEWFSRAALIKACLEVSCRIKMPHTATPCLLRWTWMLTPQLSEKQQPLHCLTVLLCSDVEIYVSYRVPSHRQLVHSVKPLLCSMTGFPANVQPSVYI